MSERYEPDPIAPEYLTKLTIERMPLEKVYFLRTDEYESAKGVRSDIWVDKDTQRFYVSADTELPTGSNRYPEIGPEEWVYAPVMRVALFAADGSMSESLIADFRRIDEWSMSFEDNDVLEMAGENIVQIDAFVSFGELGKNDDDMLDEDRDVVLSGSEMYYDALRYLMYKVDKKRAKKHKQNRKNAKAYRKLDAEAEAVKAKGRALGGAAVQARYKQKGDE